MPDLPSSNVERKLSPDYDIPAQLAEIDAVLAIQDPEQMDLSATHLLEAHERNPEAYALGVHEHLALKLCARGLGAQVAERLELFAGVERTPEVAEKFIHSGGAIVVARNLLSFEGIERTPDFAYSLITHARGEDVADKVLEDHESFDGFTPDQELFDYLVANKMGAVAAKHLAKFQLTIDRTMAYLKLVGSGGSKVIATNVEELFPDILAQEYMAPMLANNGAMDEVLDRAELFGAINDPHLAKLVLKEHGLSKILECEDVFGGMAPSELAILIIEQQADLDYPEELDDIPGFIADGDMATALIARGGRLASFVDSNSEQFHGLTKAHAEALIAERCLDTAINNPSAFEGVVPDKDYVKTILNSFGEFGKITYVVLAMSIDNYHDLDEECLRRLTATDILEEVDHLEKFLGQGNNRTDILYILKANIFRFNDISQETLDEIFGEGEVVAFPSGGTFKDSWDTEQNQWFADHMYTKLDGNWPKHRLGWLIGQRIRLGLERNTHDASQWLAAFNFDGAAGTGTVNQCYDIAYIKEHRLDPDFSAESLPQLTMYNETLQRQFLGRIIKAPLELRRRLLLTSKPEVISELFAQQNSTDHTNENIYELLISERDGQPLYAHSDLSFEMLYEMLREGGSNYRENQGMQHTLEWMEGVGEVKQPISMMLQELHAIVANRKAYIQDAMVWLTRHATTPSERLTKAWSDRALALAHGVEVTPDGQRRAFVRDSASSIHIWQQEKAFEHVVDTKSLIYDRMFPTLTREDMLGERWKAVRHEVGRVLGARELLTVIQNLHAWGERGLLVEKVIPAMQVPVEHKGKEWHLEVLGPDDPRGYTIGEDTGCCMTFYGESQSCISAGYQRPNAGFMALYDDKEELIAQSFWYIRKSHPDVLVIDNIEANRGRNIAKLRTLYQDGLRKLITQLQQQEGSPGAAIRKVHIGTMYNSVGTANLEKVKAVPPFKGVYSDAKEQRLLLEVTP